MRQNHPIGEKIRTHPDGKEAKENKGKHLLFFLTKEENERQQQNPPRSKTEGECHPSHLSFRRAGSPCLVYGSKDQRQINGCILQIRFRRLYQELCLLIVLQKRNQEKSRKQKGEQGRAQKTAECFFLTGSSPENHRCNHQKKGGQNSTQKVGGQDQAHADRQGQDAPFSAVDFPESIQHEGQENHGDEFPGSRPVIEIRQAVGVQGIERRRRQRRRLSYRNLHGFPLHRSRLPGSRFACHPKEHAVGNGCRRRIRRENQNLPAKMQRKSCQIQKCEGIEQNIPIQDADRISIPVHPVSLHAHRKGAVSKRLCQLLQPVCMKRKIPSLRNTVHQQRKLCHQHDAG